MLNIVVRWDSEPILILQFMSLFGFWGIILIPETTLKRFNKNVQRFYEQKQNCSSIGQNPWFYAMLAWFFL